MFLRTIATPRVARKLALRTARTCSTFNVLETKADHGSADFKANQAHMQTLVADLHSKMDEITRGEWTCVLPYNI